MTHAPSKDSNQPGDRHSLTESSLSAWRNCCQLLPEVNILTYWDYAQADLSIRMARVLFCRCFHELVHMLP